MENFWTLVLLLPIVPDISRGYKILWILGIQVLNSLTDLASAIKGIKWDTLVSKLYNQQKIRKKIDPSFSKQTKNNFLSWALILIFMAVQELGSFATWALIVSSNFKITQYQSKYPTHLSKIWSHLEKPMVAATRLSNTLKCHGTAWVHASITVVKKPSQEL